MRVLPGYYSIVIQTNIPANFYRVLILYNVLNHIIVVLNKDILWIISFTFGEIHHL